MRMINYRWRRFDVTSPRLRNEMKYDLYVNKKMHHANLPSTMFPGLLFQ